MSSKECELCLQEGGELLVRRTEWRVVLADEPDFPGFCRVIWNSHVREMTDLSAEQRQQMMAAVWAVEKSLRAVIQPLKINLASLGNVTPHLHWHIIPRWQTDSHFPAPIWAERRRISVLSCSKSQQVLLRQAIIEECANLN
jgi:diadenosine tetraphosphate (Ap4A) HIT family hydrolase